LAVYNNRDGIEIRRVEKEPDEGPYRTILSTACDSEVARGHGAAQRSLQGETMTMMMMMMILMKLRQKLVG